MFEEFCGLANLIWPNGPSGLSPLAIGQPAHSRPTAELVADTRHNGVMAGEQLVCRDLKGGGQRPCPPAVVYIVQFTWLRVVIESSRWQPEVAGHLREQLFDLIGVRHKETQERVRDARA